MASLPGLGSSTGPPPMKTFEGAMDKLTAITFTVTTQRPARDAAYALERGGVVRGQGPVQESARLQSEIRRAGWFNQLRGAGQVCSTSTCCRRWRSRDPHRSGNVYRVVVAFRSLG